MGESGGARERLPLSAEEFDTYKIIAAGGKLPPGRRVDRLIALGLIGDDPYGSSGQIAHDPRAVAQRLMTTFQAELAGIVDCMTEHVPALEALAAHFDPHRYYGGPGSEFLPTKEQMNARIGDLTAKATAEICTAQPGEPTDRDPEIVKLGTARTKAAIERGVQVWSLYNTVAHSHEQTRAAVGEIAAAGADVRAFSDRFPRMVLIDRQHLFVDNHVIEGAEGNSGWYITDRSAVMWARFVFMLFWQLGTRWQDLSQPEDEPVTERQRGILEALRTGCQVQQIGAKVGLATRTVKKELNALKERLGFQTLYQLADWWGAERTRRAIDGGVLLGEPGPAAAA
ncbi:LuxR C-terminal-related transcriptional regulator [Streptomyces sp. NPDC048696]|uniref:helix-turn-helix transcriptional regulator n=1 Tax=Streptomyces sp. NPDC048696 TaxID=3365585 RepID=UPI0037227151